MTRRFIAAVFVDPEDSGYVATMPGVPGVVKQGETEVEAYEDVTKALEFHVESMAEFGKVISEEPTPSSTHTIELTIFSARVAGCLRQGGNKGLREARL